MDYGELKKKYGGASDQPQSSDGKISKIVLTLVVLAITLPIIYIFYQSYYSQEGEGCFAGTRTFGDCDLSGKAYAVCCFDGDDSVVPCNEKFLGCGANVLIKVDVMKLSTPERFYLCEKYDKLEDSSYDKCLNTMTSFDETTNKMYVCEDKIINASADGYVFAFNYGRLPEFSGEVSLMEVYVADGNTPMKDVLKNVESLDNILQVKGNVIC